MAYTGLVNNPTFVESPIGIQAFLCPYVAPVGANLLAKMQSYLANYYTSGVTQSGLLVGAAPCGVFDESGFQQKTKADLLEVSPLIGGKYPLAMVSTETTIEGVFLDVDNAHWQTFFGTTAGETANVAPGAGQLGQTLTAVGNGKVLKLYTLMLRWPSVLIPVGTGTVTAWDGRVFPKVVIVPDLDIKYARKDPTKVKVSWTAIPDMNLLSPDNGTPFTMFDIDCTAAAT